METDFDSSIPRDMAWGAVMRPVPLPDINEMNKKTIMTTMSSANSNNQAKDACFQGGSRIPNTLPYPSIISRANGLLHAL